MKDFSVQHLVAMILLMSGSTVGVFGADPGDRSSADGGRLLVYFGTYSGGSSRGIYVSDFDLRSGNVSRPQLAAEVTHPSFLAFHPNGQWLYAVNEVGQVEGRPTGMVSAFEIQKENGRLRFLNGQPSGGAGPCHLSVDPSGRCVLVANYGGGSVAALPIGEDGGLKEATTVIQHEGSSVNRQRQSRPHAHSINVAPGNQFAVAADLGIDKLLVYRLDAEDGTLASHEPASVALKPGAGPRHFSFHPSGRLGFCINELDSSITTFRFDRRTGTLEALETVSALPDGFEGNNSTAEILVHPSGRFLYGSNRGHNSIAAFRIDEETGALTRIENELTQGKTPRNFGIDPTGRYLLAANQESDTVVVFTIEDDGSLKETGQIVEVPKPVCVRFLRIGEK